MSDRSRFLKKLFDANKPTRGRVYGIKDGRVYRKVVWRWVDGKLVEVPELEQSYKYSGPVVLAGGGTPNQRLIHYRIRTDAGTVDAAPTWGANEDTDFFPGFGTPFLIRLAIENTGTASGSVGGAIVITLNGAATGTTTGTTTSTRLFATDASGSADNTAITVRRLTAGAGTFANGLLDENASLTLSLTNGFHTETEYGLQFNNTAGQSLGRGDKIVFRVGTFNNSIVFPTITIPHIDGSDFAHDKNLGGTSNKTADQASLSMTTEAAAATNALILVAVATDNSGTTDNTTGNEHTGLTINGVAAAKAIEFCHSSGSAQDGATTSLWWLQYSGTLASGATITASFSNSTTRDATAMAARSYTVASGKTVSVEATNTLANSAAAVGSLDATTENGERLRVRVAGIGTSGNQFASSTGTIRVTDTTWSTWWGAGVVTGWGTDGGSLASNMTIFVEDKISTGTGSASAPVISTSEETASVYVAFKATAAGPSGTLAVTEGADTLSSAGALALQASAAISEGADTLASAGALAIQASAAITEGADTLSSAGGDRNASAAITEGADTLASAGALALQASAAISESADTLASDGTLTTAGLNGSLAVTEGADALTSSGAIIIQASAAISEGLDTLASAAALAIQGEAAISEGADALASAAALALQGNLAQSEGADVLTADGTGSVTLTGNLNVTENADTLSSAGALLLQASLAKTEGPDVLTSTAAIALQASLAKTEGADILTSTAALALQGSLAQTEGADVLTSLAVLLIQATFAKIEDPDTLSAHGAFVASIGNLNIIEGPDILAAIGGVSAQEPLTVTLFAP